MSNLCDILYKYKDDGRVCVFKNPDSQDTVISHIVYENGFSWNVERFNIHFIKGNSVNVYNSRTLGTVYECPPTPINLILKALFVQHGRQDLIIEFADFCVEQAKIYAAADTAADADDYAVFAALAAARAALVADRAADYVVFAAARAATHAAVFAAAAAAEREQYKKLIELLKKMEEAKKYE